MVDYGDHVHPHTSEVHLCSLDVPQEDDQYALGRILKVALQRSPHQHVLHVLLDNHKLPSHAWVIQLPWLHDLGARGTKMMDEQEDPYTAIVFGFLSVKDGDPH